ncbi:MAG: hypothetical protein JXR05_14445 [Flavobacteriaceae bacterium]
MNKRLLTIAIGLILGIAYFLYQMYPFAEGVIDDIPKNQTTLKDGRWVLENDTNSGIEIKDGKWTFSYVGEKTEDDDIYNITITNELPEYADTEARPGKFIVLTNQRDTLHYEILNKTDSVLSLMYFPNGSIHLYIHEKKD